MWYILCTYRLTFQRWSLLWEEGSEPHQSLHGRLSICLWLLHLVGPVHHRDNPLQQNEGNENTVRHAFKFHGYKVNPYVKSIFGWSQKKPALLSYNQLIRSASLLSQFSLAKTLTLQAGGTVPTLLTALYFLWGEQRGRDVELFKRKNARNS